MKHLFAPYELALLAKEKGFDEPCCAEHVNSEIISDQSGLFSPFTNTLTNHSARQNPISAPLYQQLVDWFRDKHDIHLTVSSATITKKCCGLIQTKSKKNSLYDNKWSNTDSDPTLSYYEALNSALTEAFKLI